MNNAVTSTSSISSSLSPPMPGVNSYHTDRMAMSPNDSFGSKSSHRANHTIYREQSLILPVVNHSETEHSIENLVDRIKHNGTLVYDHTNQIENLNLQPKEFEPLQAVVEDNATKPSPVKVLSFKERKEMFSRPSSSPCTTRSGKCQTLKDNTNSLTVSPTNQSANKRQKIDVKQPIEQPRDEVDFRSSNKENNEEQKVPPLPPKLPERTKLLTKLHLKLEPVENVSSSSSEELNNSSSLSEDDRRINDTVTVEDDESAQAMPSATEVLNSANMLQQQKAKLKSQSAVKTKTFYGGEVIKDVKSLNLATSSQKASFRINQTQSLTAITSASGVEYFEFIGACVKLEKSNLSSSRKSNYRVNFKDVAETFEYPSYEFMLKELGIDPTTDPDYQIVTPNDQFSNGFNSFLPGKSFSSPDYEDENEKTGSTDDSVGFNKLGSFTNFKPSWHNMNYELGTMDSYDHQNSLSHHRNNSTTIISSSSSPLRLNMNGDSFIINDILPSKDENSKRWSSEMDSNILF